MNKNFVQVVSGKLNTTYTDDAVYAKDDQNFDVARSCLNKQEYSPLVAAKQERMSVKGHYGSAGETHRIMTKSNLRFINARTSARLSLAAAGLFGLISCSNGQLPAPVVSSVSVGPAELRFNRSLNYLVKKGDTLFSIGSWSGHSYLELALLNDIKPPYYVYEGQTIKLEYYQE